MKKITTLIFTMFALIVFAQDNEQKIRGSVTDKLSKSPLIGVKIEIASINKSTYTDSLGNYTISGLLPDRYDLSITFIEYKNSVIPNVVVTTGKEVIVDIELEELIAKDISEVVITSNDKSNTINKLATVSARTFSMEEVNRYAGGRSDPARLAANFAGVSAPDDSRNDIVIRGNSPVGVLWRIDGMNVTNPNHFASVGTTGGAVSALNTNLLKNSDFFTSAFPAEYGNANSGVFDLGLRNGNNQKRETTLQVGVITGAELTTEGPINKEKGSSYVIGYRHALASVAQSVGIDIGTTATPSYQDLSYKINGSSSKYGRFSTFGILANSTINIGGGNGNSLYGNGNKVDFASKIGIMGVNHFKQVNKRSYFSSSIGVNYSYANQIGYKTDNFTNTTFTKEENTVEKTSYNLSTSFNTKLNSKLFLKVGLQDEIIGLNLNYKTKENLNDGYKQIWDYNSTTNLAQAYAHLKYTMSTRLKMNIGIHTQYFSLNNSIALEPRFGLTYNTGEKSNLTFGYGLHSQTQPINVYFLQSTDLNGNTIYNNKNLDFTKSHHFVIGYSYQPTKNWRIKTETYYQSIYNVPVTSYSSSYSMLNTGATFKTDLQDSLVNDGTGKNYGVELTVEKFFDKGYYGLFTTSLYESKYKGSDGIEHNTAFNGKYVLNILAGKEWKVGAKKINKFSIDVKYTNAGGRAYTPIDLAASILVGREQASTAVYSSYYSNYYRLDVKLGIVLNSEKRKIAQTFSLDFQNVTNHDNVFSTSYDDKLKDIRYTYQLGFFPNFIYKLQF